jgi:hypothetical protein
LDILMDNYPTLGIFGLVFAICRSKRAINDILK